MEKLELWIIILGSTIITFCLRGSFLVFSNKLSLPPIVQRALRFVPAAVIAALVAPALFYLPNGNLDPYNLRMVAAIIAGMVAVASKNLPLTLATGMISLWLMEWIVGVSGCNCFQPLE